MERGSRENSRESPRRFPGVDLTWRHSAVACESSSRGSGGSAATTTRTAPGPRYEEGARGAGPADAGLRRLSVAAGDTWGRPPDLTVSCQPGQYRKTRPSYQGEDPNIPLEDDLDGCTRPIMGSLAYPGQAAFPAPA